MDNETAEKIGSKIGTIIKKTAYAFAFYSIINFLGILIGNEVSMNSLKIRDESHLEILLKQEKKKLGIEDYEISASFVSDTVGSSYAINEEGQYKIFLVPRHHNLGVLKHELYHVGGGHLDRKITRFRKYYIDEPSAVIYSLTDIKLFK